MRAASVTIRLSTGATSLQLNTYFSYNYLLPYPLFQYFSSVTFLHSGCGLFMNSVYRALSTIKCQLSNYYVHCVYVIGKWWMYLDWSRCHINYKVYLTSLNHSWHFVEVYLACIGLKSILYQITWRMCNVMTQLCVARKCNECGFLCSSDANI